METETALMVGLVNTSIQFALGLFLAEIAGALGVYRLRIAWYSVGLSILLGIIVLLVASAVRESGTEFLGDSKVTPSAIASFFTVWIIWRLYRKNLARDNNEANRIEITLNASDYFSAFVRAIITGVIGSALLTALLLFRVESADAKIVTFVLLFLFISWKQYFYVLRLWRKSIKEDSEVGETQISSLKSTPRSRSTPGNRIKQKYFQFTAFGSTAKWAAKGYAKFKQTRGAIGRDTDNLNDLCHFLADAVPLISAEKKILLHHAADASNSLTEFVVARLKIEGSDIEELDLKSHDLAIQVIVEELLSRGVPIKLVELPNVDQMISNMLATPSAPRAVKKEIEEKIQCPYCSTNLVVKSGYRGDSTCPRCNEVFEVTDD